MEERGRRPKRKASRVVDDEEEESCSLDDAARLLAHAARVLVVSGSGISAAAGLSTYVNGGVYERARKKYKLRSGIELFNYGFYASRPRDCQAFLARLAEAVADAEPTRTHAALAALENSGALLRHVTMNVDGLHLAAGGSLWHGRDAAGRAGRTVELHGSVRELVDVASGDVFAADAAVLDRLKRGQDAVRASDPPRAPLFATAPAPPPDDGDGARPLRHRLRVLLYGDEEHAAIVDGAGALGVLRADAANADLVLWLGVSFEQSASCEYLRLVEAALGGAPTPQLLVNPDAEAAFAARSSLASPADVDLRSVAATSDALFDAVAALRGGVGADG